MQALQSVKVLAATDSANEDESPVATDRTPFQPNKRTVEDTTGLPKKWSSKIEVPIGAQLYCSSSINADMLQPNDFMVDF